MTDKCDLVLNLSGVCCPYSLLELNGTFKDMRKGATLEILADRASIVDEIRYWCEATGNEIVSVVTGAGGAVGAQEAKSVAPATVRLVLKKK